MFRYAEGARGVDNEVLHELELVEPGWVVIERHAVQYLVLLLQRLLFPAFVQQNSTLLLVAVSIQQVRQKARQSKHYSACICMAHDVVAVRHTLTDTEGCARQKQCEIRF